jgi:sialate O-acetylesterase
MSKFGIAALTVAMASASIAEVYLPRVISSKMVLQRGVPAPVWGWADQGEQVTVHFAGQSKKAMPDKSGKWMLKLDPMTASAEPRVMSIKGKNEIKLTDVLVGEVWLASGQSNMEWVFGRVAKEEQAFIKKQKNSPVRAFHVNHHVKAEALIKGDTVEVTSASVTAPKFVRMGWCDIAIPNLKDKNGWPVFAFPAQAVK